MVEFPLKKRRNYHVRTSFGPDIRSPHPKACRLPLLWTQTALYQRDRILEDSQNPSPETFFSIEDPDGLCKMPKSRLKSRLSS
jgi:hypothetical protein